MKKNKSFSVSLLSLFDYFFENSIYLLYFLYFLIFMYYVVLLLNEKFRKLNTITESKFIDKIRNGLNIYHYLLKLFIALYLIIKFNPIYKIKYRSSNDRNIIFNSGLLLFMSITIIDPVMMISNKLKL